ncbi:uncharacterized protein LOC121733278 [Aricia agestis]|uniref:uncharacterized protein LOC121733278 n=1 Tax=Aricia agestis TaxID=91739 RepID=UPI001C203C1D|nr:uncharacterized protein LOC121733278 [Aricia agestis]
MLFVTMAVVLAIQYSLEETVPRTAYEKDFMLGQFLNDTFFPKLKNYHINATQVPEDKYKFVAKVVHSTRHKYPVICTAACVHERIFLTAARCVYNAIPQYTRVFYLGEKIGVGAFILPTFQTKQQYDDVAFVVVDYGFSQTYQVAYFYSSYMQREDDRFDWLDKYREGVYDYYDHVVIGYATSWEDVKDGERMNNTNYNLTELDIHIGTRFCTEILPSEALPKTLSTFHVPCYHACSIHEFKMFHEDCTKYHGVEGGIVYNAYKGRIVGIATWGPYYDFNSGIYDSRSLPVGYAVPSGKPFEEAFKCARGVKQENRDRYPGTLQMACDLGA